MYVFFFGLLALVFILWVFARFLPISGSGNLRMVEIDGICSMFVDTVVE